MHSLEGERAAIPRSAAATCSRQNSAVGRPDGLGFTQGSPLAELGDRQAAPTPVLQLDLLDHDESGVERLVQHVEQELADACDERRLLIGCYGRAAGTGSFPRDLDGDDRHDDSLGDRLVTGLSARRSGRHRRAGSRRLRKRRSQEQHGIHDVPDSPMCPIGWSAARNSWVSAGMHRGLDDARGDGVHADALRAYSIASALVAELMPPLVRLASRTAHRRSDDRRGSW